MKLLEYINYLNLPAKVVLIIIFAFVVMQIIGEVLEFKGKIVPEFLKIRKIFSRRKKEKTETCETLKEVRQLLNDVNEHYSDDNIAKRDSWMQWVNDRAVAYDNSIVEIGKNLSDVTQALRDNTKLTEEMFVQNSRDRIIDFATKAANEKVPVSREEFNRIFKVYEQYERFLEEHDMTNGEIDVAYRILTDSYQQRIKNHLFIEDVRGYPT